MPGEIYERAAKSPPGYHSVAGEIVACDSSKIHVDGLTYEGAEEVFDYQTKEKVRGYKLFVIYVIELRSVLIKLFKSLINEHEADITIRWVRGDRVTSHK